MARSSDNTVPLKEPITRKELNNTNGFTFSIDEDSPMMDTFIDDNLYFKGFSSCILEEDENEINCAGDNDMSFFQRACLSMTNVTEDGGIKKKIKKPGVGSVVGDNGRVRAHYNAFLEGLDEAFDSSRSRKAPLNITLGRGKVIVGLDIALSTMKKGEISRFLISPKYGYGLLGCPPRIPPNSKILYEVELLSVLENSYLGEYEDLNEGERERLPFHKIKSVALELNKEGNEFYSQSSYVNAIKKYIRTVKVIENARLRNEEEEVEIGRVLLKSYHNMAQSYLKIGRYGRAIWCARKVLDRNPEHVKALYIFGVSQRHCGEFREAKKYLTKALGLAPKSKDIANELSKLSETERNCNNAEKVMCEKMFNFKM